MTLNPASNPENSTEATGEILPQLVSIAVADIDDSERMKPVDVDRAAAIAASMAKDGQLQPIDICRLVRQKSGKPYRLVFGGNRLAAARLNGWTHIQAIVRSADALERRAREVAENFFRAEMAPLDQARFVAELIAVEKARMGIAADKDGNALNGDKRSAKKQLKDDLCIVHKSLGLQEAVAAKLGLHRASVSRHLALNGIADSLLDRVRALPIADNAAALRQLAAMKKDEQAAVVAKFEAGGVKTMSQALGKVKVLTPDAKRQAAFMGAWGRMGAWERKAALRLLAQQSLPKGYEIVVPAMSVVAEAAE